jgi:hypothetical protein
MITFREQAVSLNWERPNVTPIQAMRSLPAVIQGRHHLGHDSRPTPRFAGGGKSGAISDRSHFSHAIFRRSIEP